MSDYPPLSSFDREHVGDILAGHGDWFSAKLMRLISTSDKANRERIRTLYPEHVEVVERHTGTSVDPELIIYDPT